MHNVKFLNIFYGDNSFYSPIAIRGVSDSTGVPRAEADLLEDADAGCLLSCTSSLFYLAHELGSSSIFNLLRANSDHLCIVLTLRTLVFV